MNHLTGSRSPSHSRTRPMTRYRTVILPPVVILPDGRRAEIVRKHEGEASYVAIVRACGRDRRPVAKVTIRPDGETWVVVREAVLAQVGGT